MKKNIIAVYRPLYKQQKYWVQAQLAFFAENEQIGSSFYNQFAYS